MRKAICLVLVVLLLGAFSVSAFAESTTVDGQKVIENNIASDTNTDLGAMAAQANDDKTAKIDVKSFKGKFSDLFSELQQLREECKGLWTNIKSVNQSIRTEWKSYKESLKGKSKEEIKQAVTELKGKIEPLRTNAKTLHADIKALRAQKTTEWTNFRAAVKARDEVKAQSALSNIISLKKQIIEKQKELLQVKNQILAAI